MTTMWDQFLDTFEEGVWICMKTGDRTRLMLSTKSRNIVVDIFPQGATMKKFDQIMLSEVKDKTGIHLVKVKE